MSHTAPDPHDSSQGDPEATAPTMYGPWQTEEADPADLTFTPIEDHDLGSDALVYRFTTSVKISEKQRTIP